MGWQLDAVAIEFGISEHEPAVPGSVECWLSGFWAATTQ
jgi:hypothetical protein